MGVLTNIYLWIGTSLFFILVSGLLFLVLVILKMKTHAIIELKAWLRGKPIALFFQENRYCEWRAVDPEAGIIQDKDYGAFIVNEKATYIDKTTKNVLIPFDASFGASINVHAAKMVDDLQYIVKDEQQMKMLRYAIANNLLDDSAVFDSLKTSIHFGALKNMMNALVPHNINAKIEKVIASRMKGYGQINVPQVALIFVAIFGAILLGALVIKLAFPKPAA
jgi:hypothetical protein